jgi:hypothetical protein
MYTYLGWAAMTGDTMPTAFTKLCPIKDFPDLGGSPDQIDVTDLDDDVQKFILGVQSMSAMEFTANYDLDTYKELQSKADGTTYAFCVAFGKNATDATSHGVFTWQGQLAVWVVGGGVNAAREMKISISALSKVTLTESATITTA